MNKWQIICPLVALLITALTFRIIQARGEHRNFITAASYTIGGDLIARTNSSHLVHIGPHLQSLLSELIGAPTHALNVLLGDEPWPFGNGTDCGRLWLTNDLGLGL